MMNYFINVLLMLELKPFFEYQLLFEDLQYLTLLKPSTTKSAHDVFVELEYEDILYWWLFSNVR